MSWAGYFHKVFTKILEFPHCQTLSIKLCWASQAQHHQLGQNKNSDFPNLLGAPPNFLFIFTQFVDYNRKVASAQYGPHWGTQLFQTHQDQSKNWVLIKSRWSATTTIHWSLFLFILLALEERRLNYDKTCRDQKIYKTKTLSSIKGCELVFFWDGQEILG